MAEIVKKHWQTLLFFTIVGLAGGFFVGIYLLDTYPPEIQAELISELDKAGLNFIPHRTLLGLITAIQSAGYGAVLGAVGIYFAKRTGLFNDEISITKRPLIITLIASLVGGIMMILPDMLVFNNLSDAIAASYATKPDIAYILASVTYGAVIEEVMMRLFMMSAVAFILHLIFERSKDMPSERVMIIANIVSALLFVLGHLPATLIMLGSSFPIILRCILLNGGFGLLFGYLDRRFGLRYAMIAHGGCHIVSKLIWIIFI